MDSQSCNKNTNNIPKTALQRLDTVELEWVCYWSWEGRQWLLQEIEGHREMGGEGNWMKTSGCSQYCCPMLPLGKICLSQHHLKLLKP